VQVFNSKYHNELLVLQSQYCEILQLTGSLKRIRDREFMVQDLSVHQHPTVPGCSTPCSQYFPVTSAAQFILHQAGESRFKSQAERWMFGFCGVPHSRQANTGSVSRIRPQLLSYIPSTSIITNFPIIHHCIICPIALSFYNAAFKLGIMPKWSRPTAFT
jgi:hypothetical protein